MHPMIEMFTADIRHYIAARGLDLVDFAKGQHKDEVARARQRYASVPRGIAWRLLEEEMMAGKFLVLWKLELRRATPDVARAVLRQQDYGTGCWRRASLRRGITWWVGMGRLDLRRGLQ